MTRRVFGLGIVAACLASTSAAQWISYPTPGIPRNPDGSANLEAPAPHRSDGTLDLTGMWLPMGGYVGNIARDIGVDAVPFQPWAKELYQHRRDTLSIEDPTGWCVPGGVPRSDAVPYPLRILHAPEGLVILYEAVHHFRQIFTDGRELPGPGVNPTWLGYSVGRWEGDAFVAETTGFNDHGWIDNWGLPNTEALHVTERFLRRDFGHLDIEVTIDDPKAYTAPWTVTLPLSLQVDTELLEYICAENEKDLDHLVGN